MRRILKTAVVVAGLCGLVACGSGEVDEAPPGANNTTPANNAANNNTTPEPPDLDWIWGDGEPPAACSSGVPGVGEGALRRLTRVEYDNTVADLLGVRAGASAGFTPDEKVGGFNSNGNIPVSELAVEQYMEASEGLAREAITHLPELLPCDPASGDEQACARQFVTELGRKAWRRPLDAPEITRLLEVYTTERAQHSSTDAFRVVIQALLQSPHFLYHVEAEGEEVAPGVMRLSSHAIAARLSYFIWGSMPDETLRAAADADALGTPEAIEAQARRMLADPRSRRALADFHRQWLHIEDLEKLEKDAAVYPEFTPQLRDSMIAETEAFIEGVIREGDGRLETLLTASWTYVDSPLAELYGVEGVLPPPETFHREAEDVGSEVGGATGNAWNLWSNGQLKVTVDLPAAGVWQLSARVWGTQAGPEVVQMLLGAEAGSAERFDVTAGSEADAQVFVVPITVTAAGPQTFYVEFLNDYYDPDAGADRNLLVDWVSAQGPFTADGSAGGPMERVELNPAQRSGLLTLPGVMATHAKANQSSPIHRGKFVRERLLCQVLPAPPPNVEIVPPPLDPSLSTRERFSQHSADPSCAGCHQLMDPIGFGFEHYDGLGRWREAEASGPIDATGSLIATMDLNGTFDGAVDLGQRLAVSDEVRRCVATQWFRFALRRLEAEPDLCSLQRSYAAFAGSDFDLRELMVAVARSDAFRYRRAQEEE